jgi:hypothetical protein
MCKNSYNRLRISLFYIKKETNKQNQEATSQLFSATKGGLEAKSAAAPSTTTNQKSIRNKEDTAILISLY